MFDLGWSKILILAVVAIVVVGPKELPSLLRTLGQFIAQLRRHAAEFRAQFDEAMRSTELDQIRRDVEAIKSDATASIQGIGKTLEQDLAEAKASVEQAVEAKPPEPPAIEAASASPAPDHVNGTTASAAPAEPPALAEASALPEPLTLPDPPPFALPTIGDPAVVADPVPARHADSTPTPLASEKTGARA